MFFYFFVIDYSLISNALNINTNGRSSTTNMIAPANQGFQRRMNVARLNFDDSSNGSPIKMSSEEMSLYSGNTPQGSPRPCSISPCLEMGLLSPSREHETIEERHDIDYNSTDSGYGSRKMFTFAQPALPPKRNDTISPPKTTKTASPKSISCFRSFNSLSSDSMESMDDDCMDLLDMEALDDNAQLPTSFNSIICGNIKSNSSNIGQNHCSENLFTLNSNAAYQQRNHSEMSRTPVFRRCLSMTDANVNRGKPYEPSTPELFKSIPEMGSPSTFQGKFDGITKTFKRPEPPSVGSPIQCKRYKQSIEDKENLNELPIVTRPKLRQSLSMNDDIIMSALSRCKFYFSFISFFHNSKHLNQLNIKLIEIFSFYFK